MCWTLEPEYQNAVAGDRLSLVNATELFRVAAALRAPAFAAFQRGVSRSEVRKLARAPGHK